MVGFGRISRQFIFGLVILFFTFNLYAADTAEMEISPGRVVRKNKVTIKIKTEIPWGEKVDIEMPELEKQLVWWAYPYARPWTKENENGEKKKFVEVLCSIRVEESGFFKIGSFIISSNGKTAVTMPADVIGLEADEADLPYPVVTIWRNIPQEIWQNQAVPVVAEARNLVTLAFADSAYLTKSPAGILEKLDGYGEIQTRTYGNNILFDVPAASWMWTLNEPGTYKFPNAVISIMGLKRSTPSFSLTVKPLPPSVLSSGAVGNFSLDTKLDRKTYRAGDVIKFSISISGSGNLNVLKMPEPDFGNFAPVNHTSSSSYIPSENGYKGQREELYEYQIEKPGDYSLEIPEWYWLNPEEGGVVQKYNKQSFPVKVIKAVSTYSEEDKLESLLLGTDSLRYRTDIFNWKNPYLFFLILPGFLFLFFYLLLPGKNWINSVLVLSFIPFFFSFSSGYSQIKAESDISKAVITAENGDPESALSIYKKVIMETGEIPGLLHDMSLLEAELGNLDKSEYYIRRAIYLRPGTSVFSAALSAVEDHFNITDQIQPPYNISPSLLFSLWIISINSVFLTAAFFIRKKEPGSGFTLIFASAVLVFLSIFLISAQKHWNQETAVITGKSEQLRRIPEKRALDWISLRNGIVVRIKAEESSYYLVETGFGLEGWLPAGSVMLVSEKENGF